MHDVTPATPIEQGPRYTIATMRATTMSVRRWAAHGFVNGTHRMHTYHSGDRPRLHIDWHNRWWGNDILATDATTVTRAVHKALQNL